jgi:hypothetical protein
MPDIPFIDAQDLLAGLPGIGPVLAVPDAIDTARDLAKKDTRRRLSQVLRDNGWPVSVISTARQVAVAESGGRANERGDGGPKLGCKGKPTSIGLFQVRGFDNQCNRVHAGKAGSPTDYDGYVKWAEDPDNNARIALVVWKEAGNSFKPWTVYKTGAYKLSGNRDPIVTTKEKLGVDDIPIVGDAVDAAGGALDVVGDFIGLITDRDTWFRIGKGFVGLNLITIGFVGLIVIALKDPIKATLKTGAKTAAKTPGVGGAAGKAAKVLL